MLEEYTPLGDTGMIQQRKVTPCLYNSNINANYEAAVNAARNNSYVDNHTKDWCINSKDQIEFPCVIVGYWFIIKKVAQ